MIRTITLLVGLALGLGVASAFAQPAPPPSNAPEDSTAARTLEQNRRVFIGRPAPSEVRGTAVESEVSARGRTRAPVVIAPGRVDLAAGGDLDLPR
jgi:hypothetical protein